MLPDMRNPAAFAAAGIASPSAHDAWWGSPQAICTTSIPSRSRNFFSSGTLVTCNDQLHTPIASGSIAMIIPPGFDAARLIVSHRQHRGEVSDSSGECRVIRRIRQAVSVAIFRELLAASGYWQNRCEIL